MKPCMVADPLPGSSQGSYQRCEADFVSNYAYTQGSIVPQAEKVNKFSLSEVGLGQNNSTLVLSFQGGQAVISIDIKGRATVQMNRLVEAHLAE